MIPGVGSAMRQAQAQVDDKDLVRIQAMIQSMTMQERQQPSLIKGRRIGRIARGSGMQESDVHQLLSQFRQMQQMMKQLGALSKGGRGRGLPGLGGLGNIGKLLGGDLSALGGPGGALGGLQPPLPRGSAPRQPSGLPTAPPVANLSQARHQAKKKAGKRRH
jgi:signal recognition particle subunit SRP54